MGQGNVLSRTVGDGALQSASLKDVILVPQLASNLIFVGSCRKNGVRVKLESNKVGSGICTALHVPSSRHVFLGVKNKENRLFEVVLTANAERNSEYVSTKGNSSLRHAGLGDAGATTIQNKIPIVSGMNLQKAGFLFLVIHESCASQKGSRDIRGLMSQRIGRMCWMSSTLSCKDLSQTNAYQVVSTMLFPSMTQVAPR